MHHLISDVEAERAHQFLHDSCAQCMHHFLTHHPHCTHQFLMRMLSMFRRDCALRTH
jgi:hypothetical protein